MNLYSEFKYFYLTNIILFIILLFIIIYLIINREKIFNGEMSYGNIIGPILITGIIFIIIHLFVTWDNNYDDNENKNNNDEIIFSKFKLGKDNDLNNDIIGTTKNGGEIQNQPLINNTPAIISKYKISNKSFDINTSGNTDKLSNQNIFISQKNLNKYGLKF